MIILKPKRPSQIEIRRYMDVVSVLDMLLNKHLILLNPKSWDDKNDSFFLEAYRKRLGLKAVRAACFSTKPETYHHWRCFAPGLSGACIIFYKDKLLEYVDKRPDLRGGLVKYKTNQQLQRMGKLADDDLPFLKRWPYQDEGEYRVIYEDDLWECDDAHGIDLPLETIKRIVVSPWCPQSLYLSLKSIIRTLDGCNELTVNRSLLVDTEMWKDALTAIHDRAFAPTEQDDCL
ncbi:MAG TPA: hypothetical protein VGO55_05945 [Allosphingosinicella sp.]|nr:hypothetical protein [Allosphingosinicella sp.]